LGLDPLEDPDHDDDEDDDDDDELIDSFLRGEYDYEISDSAPCPHPDLAPASVVRDSLNALRKLDDPTPSHGAAVFHRFLLPLSRRERWGDFAAFSSSSSSSSSSSGARRDGGEDDPWRVQVMQGALTPHLLARQIRASADFSCLLDWTTVDVTDGTYGLRDSLVGVPSMAFVNAALHFEPGRVEPVLVQFVLRRVGGVWLIDTARRSSMDQFDDCHRNGGDGRGDSDRTGRTSGLS
jgi:hypothetical protein